MTPTTRALKYATDVTTGKIPNCKWVVLACQRFLNDLQKQNSPDFPYVYDAQKADRFVNFLEKLPHTKGKWAAKKELYTAENWQAFIDCNLFGWVHRDTRFRRFRVAFELIPRKNGKSFRVAGRGIYLAFVDGERGAEVYSGATSEKQAFEVFRPAWQMVDGLPNLKSRFGIQTSGNGKNPGTIFTTTDMSKFEVMIGKPGDGASPHGAIIDEYHEHDSDHMVDTMQTGMGAREQPLLSVITTAGSNLGGPCYEMQQDMQRILEGSVKDETTFAIMYGIDPADSWDTLDSLIKANPNYGVSIFPDFLMAQLEQAKRSASKQNAFRTKHLNEWVGAKTAWMNMVEWNKQERKMNMEDFKDVPCHLSADLSSKKDITAIDITFKKEDQYFSFKKFFVPEMALEENEKYMDFHTAGFLETTPGAMLDQEEVEEYITDVLREYDVIDCTFDEWNADYMMSRLAKRKIDVVKFPFNVRHVSEPMKTLEALVLDGKYFHDGNPVQTWMMGNVVSFEDKRGNVFPNKARPNDQKCKKDGVDVSIMSIGRYMTEDEPKPEYQMMFV